MTDPDLDHTVYADRAAELGLDVVDLRGRQPGDGGAVLGEEARREIEQAIRPYLAGTPDPAPSVVAYAVEAVVSLVAAAEQRGAESVLRRLRELAGASSAPVELADSLHWTARQIESERLGVPACEAGRHGGRRG